MNIKRKKILITGTRAPCALEIVRHLHFAGHEIISAESLKHSLCRFSCCIKQSEFVPPPRQAPQAYIEALVHLIKTHQVDLLIPTCEEIFTIAKFQDQLKCHCEIFCEDFDKLIRLHDKGRFIEWAKEIGLSTPFTWKLESQEEVDNLVENLPFDIILKPVFSRFASEIHRISKNNPKVPQIMISNKRPWVAQQFLEGGAFCTYSVVKEGKMLAHTTYPAQIRAGQGACIYFEHIEQKQIEAWIEKFVNSIKFTGQIAFDFIQDSNGIFYPIESNPRATSGVHLFETNQYFANVFLGGDQLIRPKPTTKKMVGLAMLFYGVSALRTLKRLQNWGRSFSSAKDVIFNWRDIGPFFSQFITFFSYLEISPLFRQKLVRRIYT